MENRILIYGLFCYLILGLAGCSSDSQAEVVDLKINGASVESGQKMDNEGKNFKVENDQFSTEIITEEISDDKSKINDNSSASITVNVNKCIGCGKCVKLAPENFALSNGKAEVISQVVDAGVTKAVSSCPVGAISV